VQECTALITPRDRLHHTGPQHVHPSPSEIVVSRFKTGPATAKMLAELLTTNIGDTRGERLVIMQRLKMLRLVMLPWQTMATAQLTAAQDGWVQVLKLAGHNK
jgi:hypothetical protein